MSPYKQGIAKPTSPQSLQNHLFTNTQISVGLWFLGERIKVARAPSPAGIGKNMAKMAVPLSATSARTVRLCPLTLSPCDYPPPGAICTTKITKGTEKKSIEPCVRLPAPLLNAFLGLISCLNANLSDAYTHV
ncbi:MAG: hypothetical protein SGI98_08090 [Verrucomicrobiota bacterium]|nr:hypothetical protein [Verrucomicrobiota bacterium]